MKFSSSLVVRRLEFSPESTGTTTSTAPVTSTTLEVLPDLQADVDVDLVAAAESDAGLLITLKARRFTVN